MSAGSLVQSPSVRRVLEHCRRQITRHTVLRGVAMVLIAFVVCVLLAATLDFLIGIPAPLRAALLAGSLLAGLWAAWRSLIKPLATRIPDQEVGAAVDLTVPELQESLATVISLGRPDVTSGEAGSALMRQRLEEQVATQLKQLKAEHFVDGRRTLRRCGTAAGLMLLVLLPALLWPSGTQLLAFRLLMPFANLESATNLYFEIPNGDRTVARGHDVRIAAAPKWRTQAHGERPEQVWLTLYGSNGQSDSLTMSFDELSGTYQADIPKIADTVQFTVRGGGATSKRYTVHVVDAPEIAAAVMTAIPPVYTGRAIERFDGMIGRMSVFETSELQVLLEFNKPVESATLVWLRRDKRPVSDVELFDRQFDHLTGEEIFEIDPSRMDPDALLVEPTEPLAERIEAELTADRTGATITMTADVGGDFVFEVRDQHDLLNPSEPDRTIELIYDKAPQLTVTGIRVGDRFRPDDILPVNCLVVDDVGIGDLELQYRLNDNVTRILPADGIDRGARRISHGFRLNLTELNVSHGDFLTVRVRTEDERPNPKPHEVWSEEFVLEIDDNAEATGARALDQDTRLMIEALKQLEEQLQKDADKARKLKEQTDREWTDEAREEAQRLSEKEQQQGSVLEQIAGEVETHPLMQQSARKLTEISQELRQSIPDQLAQAIDAERTQAGERLDNAGRQLDEARRQLNAEIERIEKLARLEQDLAELNRLALEAEQVASDAKQLDQDRRESENRPEELSEQQWQQQLEQRQQQLSREREGLSSDLSQLLQEQPELLKSAQQSQREQLQALSEKVAALARQQQRLAEGVKEEAREAAREAGQIADQLQQAKADAQKLNQELQTSQSPVDRPDLAKLDAAVQSLRDGDLAEPQRQVSETAAEFQKTERQLKADPAPEQESSEPPAAESGSDPAPSSDPPLSSDEAARRSAELAERLAEIGQQIRRLRQERQADPSSNNSEPASDPDAPAAQASPQDDSAPQDGSAPQDAGTPQDESATASSEPRPESSTERPNPLPGVLQRVDELAEAAQQMAENLAADAQTEPAAQNNADEAARRASEGRDEAGAGRFSRSARQLRDASDASQRSAAAINGQAQPDQQKQMQGLQDELNRMADTLQRLQQDNGARAAAQQQSQQQIAQDVSRLPEELNDLAERLNIPALQMPEAARQAGEAQQAAAQAQQSSEQAADGLQQGQLQQAGRAGQETAARLNQLSTLAQQAGQQSAQQDSPVPSEVGESVADALQDLQQAAQAMQQASGQQAAGESDQLSEQADNGQSGQSAEGDSAGQSQDGQPGQQDGASPSGSPSQNGQPGKPSGSEQLSDAAKALAQAAQDALPQQYNPGQMNDGSDSASAGRDAMGNAAMWDGRVAGAAEGPAGSRDWGGLNDELDTETSDKGSVSRDSEYEALIRMYFREAGKVLSDN
ncbi:MAG: hypothetical protein RIK87_26725 [Fuerstiella sp.]